MRIKQWYKNLIVFIPLVFSGVLLNTGSLWLSILAFICFCLASSGVYILNDIKDIEEDKKHPKKKNRPIASGRISAQIGVLLAIVLLFLSLAMAYYLGNLFLGVLGLFFLSNAIYSLWAKHKFIIDTMFIGANFVIRAMAGVIVLNAEISPWLLVIAFFIALYLAFAKRRSEIGMTEGNTHRKNLMEYKFVVDRFILLMAGVIVLTYVLYTFEQTGGLMILTIPFVVYGITKHMYLVYEKNIGEATEAVFKDKSLVTAMLLWGVVVVAILYSDKLVGLW